MMFFSQRTSKLPKVKDRDNQIYLIKKEYFRILTLIVVNSDIL